MLKNRITLYLVTSLVVFICISNANAQLFKNDNKYRHSTVGIGFGSSHYFGDLSPYSTFYHAIYSNVRWNATLNYQINLNPKFSARMAFTYGRIFGNDATYGGTGLTTKGTNRLRNLHFRNDLMEFTAIGIYNFNELKERKSKNTPISLTPYVGIGLGIIGHDPKARGSIQTKQYAADGTPEFELKLPNDDGKYVLQPWKSLRNEDTEVRSKVYSSIAPVIPIIVGVKTRLNNKWILAVEAGYRFTFTDYLDDVSSGNYTNKELSYRANEDYYALTGKPRNIDYAKLQNLPLGLISSLPSVDSQNRLALTAPRGTSKKDSYIFTQITLNYIIGDGIKCPPLIK